MHSYDGISAALDEFKPDIIEVGCAYRVPWSILRFYKNQPKKNRPVIVGFYHADFPQSDVYNSLKGFSPWLASKCKHLAQRYAAKVYNRLDLCLVSSPAMQTKLQNSGITNVVATPFGVDTELFQPLVSPKVDDDKLHLLYVGRLSADKGILPFIDVMHRLVAEGINADLTIVGQGYLEEAAQKKAAGVSYIHFLPYIHSKKELAKIYSNYDLLIVPNPHETFCLSALEAMACGTPVASLHGLGGIQTIINSQTGFLLGDKLEAFIPFLKNISRSQLLSMRSEIRSFIVEKFSHKKRFANLLTIYENLRQQAHQ
jgi:alpha-1,6-mannosyltransferase